MAVDRFEKVSEVVARRILDDIVARELPPGTVLPSENAMLEQFEVGRGSMREALRILEVMGLIRVKAGPRGGPTVAHVTSREFGRMASFFFHVRGSSVSDLLEARLLLEPIMARLAAERLASSGRAGELIANIEAAQRVHEDPGPEWGRISGDFHGLVAGMSGNPILDLMSSSLNDIHTERVSTIFPIGQRREVLDIHGRIAAAILDGNADEAERLARRHMEELVKRVRKLGPGLVDGALGWR